MQFFPDSSPPPNENSKKAPLNIYGKSKDKAEEFLSKHHHLIIRTTIVGLNTNVLKQSFAEWIINSLRKNISLNLFEDVYFNPITIWHLGKQIEKLIYLNLQVLCIYQVRIQSLNLILELSCVEH